MCAFLDKFLFFFKETNEWMRKKTKEKQEISSEISHVTYNEKNKNKAKDLFDEKQIF